MTRPSRAKTWVTVGIEAGGSLVLVLVIFTLFMAFLHAIFPEGTPLKEIVEGSQQPGPGRYAGGRQAEATLSALQHDVRFRRGNSVAWGGASEGMPLYSQDAVQTLDRSGATISFSPKDQLLVGSNSLVLVTRLNAEDEVGAKKYRVQVDGELRGSLSANRKLRMEVSAAGHLARMGGGAARFRVVAVDKESAGFAVYQGEAQIVGKGRAVLVPAHYGLTLKKGVAVGPPLPLPAAPTLGQQKARYRFRLLPPKVRFSWSAPSGDFHFQLSRDPHFGKCLIDEKVSESGRRPAATGGVSRDATRPASPASPASESHGFLAGKLTKGRYYWRVSRIEEGREGAFSPVGECELVQELGAPKLEVNFPPERVEEGTFVLTGSAPEGSRVYIDGVEVQSAGAGDFSRELRLKPGVNLIRVEALDAAGNASYASRIVYLTPYSSRPAR